MLLREKIQVVVISVVVSLALAGVVYQFIRPDRPLGGDEDAPILIAGGSLYLGTQPTYEFRKDGDVLKFAEFPGTESNRYVAKIVGTNKDDVEKTLFEATNVNGENVTVTIDYVCVRPFCTGKDEIKLSYTAGGVITISDGDARHPIARAPRLLLNLRAHPRRVGWEIKTIEVTRATGNPTPLECGNGECAVIVSTCKLGDDCVD